MKEFIKERAIFLFLSAVWIVMISLAVYFNDLIAILITCFISYFLFKIVINDFKDYIKYRVSFRPDTLPIPQENEYDLLFNTIKQNLKEDLMGTIRYSFIITDKGEMNLQPFFGQI